MLDSIAGKTFVKELTMEYIKQNELLKCKPEDIELNMKKIVDASNLIYDSVENHFHDFKHL